MAELHLARLSGIGGFSKLVAIKLMLPHLSANPDFVELFLNEGRIAARISHPNVCQVFEIGEADGQLFLVMEYLEGVTWDELLKQMPADPVITLRATASVLAQIAEGLHHAHELRDAHGTATPVIHRDVSPQNLFITTDGICKVLDFGVAKMASSPSQTRTGVLKGKLPYMSPEQTKGEPLDARSDVFSTGIVLWEALAKRPLFMREAEFQIWLAITSEPIVPPSTFEPAYERGIDAVVMRALQRDRMARFPSMRVFAEELRDATEPYGGALSVTELAAFVRERCDDKLVARSIELASLHTPQETIVSKRNDATVTDAPALGSVMLRADSRILGRPRKRWPYAVAALVAIAIAIVTVIVLRRDTAPDPIAVASAVPAPPAPVKSAPVEPAPVEAAPVEPAPLGPPAVEPRSTPAPRRRPTARIADARPTKVGTGTLSVDTRPTARVYIDGVFVDETPLFKHALPAGKHEIRLVRGDKDAWRRAITIHADRLTNLGNVQW
jgi:serine/threonine protein kinase